MSAAAKDPEGSGLDTLSPLNVKGNRGPLHSRTGGVVRTGARAPSWPPPQPSTPHSQAHCPGGGGPLAPATLPLPLPQNPTPSSPALCAHFRRRCCPRHRDGREGSRVCPAQRPPPSWKDRGPRTTSPPAKFWHLLPRTPPAGRPARCAQTEKNPLPEHWVPPLPPSCLCVPPRGSQPGCAQRAGCPLLGRPRGPRSQGAHLGTMGHAGESSRFRGAEFHPRARAVRPYPRRPCWARTRAGRRRGPASRREAAAAGSAWWAAGRVAGSDVALGPGRSAARAPAPHERGVGLQHGGARNRAERCGGRDQGALSPLPGPVLRPEGWVPPVGLGVCLPPDLQIPC